MNTEKTQKEPIKDKAIPSISELFQLNAKKYVPSNIRYALNLHYADAVAGLRVQAIGFIREPNISQEPIIRLVGGQVLKFGTLEDRQGQRSFDCPVLETGLLQTNNSDLPDLGELTIPDHYYIQHEVEVAHEFELVRQFVEKIESAGWTDSDIGYAGQGQVGWLPTSTLGSEWVNEAKRSETLVVDDNNRALVLIDYESVT